MPRPAGRAKITGEIGAFADAPAGPDPSDLQAQRDNARLAKSSERRKRADDAQYALDESLAAAQDARMRAERDAYNAAARDAPDAPTSPPPSASPSPDAAAMTRAAEPAIAKAAEVHKSEGADALAKALAGGECGLLGETKKQSAYQANMERHLRRLADTGVVLTDGGTV